MFIDVHLEALAIALVFPVRNFVAQTVEIRIAAEIEIANNHAAEMADMADASFAYTQGPKKCNECHDGHNGAHFDRYGDGNDVNAAVGKEDGAGNENTEDRSGSADSGNLLGGATPQERYIFHDEIQDACTNAGQKVVVQEAIAAPDKFQFTAEHPEHQHVHDDV